MVCWTAHARYHRLICCYYNNIQSCTISAMRRRLPPSLPRRMTTISNTTSNFIPSSLSVHATNCLKTVKSRYVIQQMKISEKAYCSNPHAAKRDDYEPEYLEPVTHTADKMRASVRDYIAEYSHRCGGDSVEKGETDYDHNNAAILSQCPPPIKLVGILATTIAHPVSKENCHYSYCNDPYGNETYSQQIATCCSSDGIVYEPWRVPPTIEALERAIHHANERLDIHGILVFYPVFDKLTNAEKKGRTYKCQATGVYYRSMDDYFRDLVACLRTSE